MLLPIVHSKKGHVKMNGESCDYCETANVKVRQTDTTTLEVTDHWRDGKSKKLITVGIFACDDCYKYEVVSGFQEQIGK